MKREQVRDIFTKYGKETFSLWFSGMKGVGEYKSWHANGRLATHGFMKKGRIDGENKAWHVNGELLVHQLYKDGVMIKNLL